MTIVIYGVVDPRNQELRYVGKTVKYADRCQEHIKSKGNTHRERWFTTLRNCNVRPEFFILEETSLEEWRESEAFWIGYFKSLGCRLVNSTAGGEGITPTIETKLKQSQGIRASWARPDSRKRHLEALRIAKALPESRERQRIAANDPVSNAKRSASCIEALSSPEVRAKISSGTITGLAKPGVKERHRKAVKLALNRPEFRERRRVTDATPETQARRISACIRIGNDPVIKAKRQNTRLTNAWRWVTDGENNAMIPKGQLVPDGWRLGVTRKHPPKE